uniref:Uncharacterized protein n=1 Tax=Micromonospora sp. ML1 TaxID=349725 RepID=Q333W6_9ACTN|nr:hypothetical protein [Micromonospora sp. ML1]
MRSCGRRLARVTRIGNPRQGLQAPRGQQSVSRAGRGMLTGYVDQRR